MGASSNLRTVTVPSAPTSRSTATARSRARASGRWRAAVFAPAGDGIRARLGSDAWRVGLSVLGLVVVFFAYRQQAHLDQWIVKLTVPPPTGVAWLLTVLAFAGTYGATLLLLVTSIVSRRRPVLIDVLGAGAVALLVTGLLRLVLGVTAGVQFSSSYAAVDVGIPVPSLAVAVAMALGARPYLARSFQRLCYLAFTLGALCLVIDGKGLLLSVLASVLIGWGAAAAVRLATGTPSGLPGAAMVASMLGELGIEVRSVSPTIAQSWGAARYDAVRADGAALRVSVYGRDARDAELASTLGRTIAYRDEGTALFVTRLQQAEHEAYVTLRAAAALNGGTTEVLAAGRAGPSRDGVVVTVRPEGVPLAALLDDPAAMPPGIGDRLLAAVGALGAESLSHGSIDPDHVLVAPDGAIVLDDFLRGTSSASPQRASRDLASAVTCAALAVGPDDALETARRVVGDASLLDALPYLQSGALPSSLAAQLKQRRPELLATLREEGASRLGVDPPELAKLTRVSVTTLVLALGTLIGGWALIGVLLNVANSFDTIRGANVLWVGAVAILASLAYPASAISCEGSIPTTLPYRKLVKLELSNTFSGLAVGTVAVLGARVRFFQKQGIDATTAVSSGVLVSTASWIVKGALFLIALPFAWSSFHLATAEADTSGSGKAIIIVLIAICVVGLALGVALFIPRIRATIKKKLAPKAAEIRGHLVELAQHPAKLAEVFGGCVIGQLLVALALGASLHAFGAHLSLAQLLIVLTLGSVLGGISPVPGGMGVVEAGMILGLTAVGIPEDIAVSAVFVQRLFTAYLPPIAGWFALISLRRQDLL
jgi:glycosyltransferase 2 family protein